jgi:hypothetical protein
MSGSWSEMELLTDNLAAAAAAAAEASAVATRTKGIMMRRECRKRGRYVCRECENDSYGTTGDLSRPRPARTEGEGDDDGKTQASLRPTQPNREPGLGYDRPGHGRQTQKLRLTCLQQS